MLTDLRAAAATFRRLIIVMAACQVITALCAIFVAVSVARVEIYDGKVRVGGNVWISGQPIEVRTGQ